MLTNSASYLYILPFFYFFFEMRSSIRRGLYAFPLPSCVKGNLDRKTFFFSPFSSSMVLHLAIRPQHPFFSFSADDEGVFCVFFRTVGCARAPLFPLLPHSCFTVTARRDCLVPVSWTNRGRIFLFRKVRPARFRFLSACPRFPFRREFREAGIFTSPGVQKVIQFPWKWSSKPPNSFLRPNCSEHNGSFFSQKQIFRFWTESGFFPFFRLSIPRGPNGSPFFLSGGKRTTSASNPGHFFSPLFQTF